MTVRTYKSTDASAPSIRGQAGDLVALYDACLVNGYGSKAAAGWAKAYSGTNKAAYRAASGARHFFRIDDSTPVTQAAGREGYLRGYEDMTTVDAGTGPFPTTTQAATGLVQRKSRTADTAARSWVVIADEKSVYTFIYSDDYAGYAATHFGEFYSIGGSGDAYRSIVIGMNAPQGIATGQVVLVNPASEPLPLLSALTAAAGGHFVPRSAVFPDIQSPIGVGKHGNAAHSAAVLVGFYPYPHPIDGGMHLARVSIHEPTTGHAHLRGRLRGLWHFLHPVASPINDGDTWTGTGELAGKTFMMIRPSAAGNAVFVMETSSTWETN